jgi:hypothetical protein
MRQLKSTCRSGFADVGTCNRSVSDKKRSSKLGVPNASSMIQLRSGMVHFKPGNLCPELLQNQ